MLSFLAYEGKAAIALTVFYMFYRLLLKKESLHRLNRMALVGMVVVSFLLPLCIITVHKPMETAPAEVRMQATERASAALWWPMALTILFWAGVVFVLAREVISILSVIRIIRRSQFVLEEDGCQVFVTEREIDPFSWMRFIVLSQKDWASPHETILTHEKAHVRYRHSVDLLLVDTLTALQWFNPAIWMLRMDLQEIHEYEADDAVLQSGADIKEYQYLLVRKSVGKSGYSVANSLNHSILKNRITMMLNAESPRLRGLRVLWLLPVVCLGICLQVRTVYVPQKKQEQRNPRKIEPVTEVDGTLFLPESAHELLFLRDGKGEERRITRKEHNELPANRLKHLEIIRNASAIEKYGPDARNGVIIIELEEPEDSDHQ